MTSPSSQTVLITGATGDFGKAFAARFIARGDHVILHGRSADKLAALQQELDGNTSTLCFDVTDADAVAKAMKGLPAIDVLINNAGGALGLDKAQDADLADWETMVEMNVLGLLRVTNPILKTMAERKKGLIINIGSIAGTYPYPGGHVYCATKAFVRQFSLAMRADLSGTHIRVTNIEPGMVETQFSLMRFKGDSEKAASVYANTTPLTADDIAETVFWVASLPPHVNINALEIMPTVQSFGPLPVERHG
ncbi:MAG: SDR family NAD(P)-dependent oxidoreductase [Pseudobdellovibrionaceae bacterium]